jgi:outer membrane receptor for ferrienterochelin and colicin
VQQLHSQTLPPDVLVTGSRIPGADALPGANVTLITRQLLDARQPSSVVEALRQVSGLHIDQKGGRGGVSSVYVRGADPNYTLVLIDGVPVNDPTDSRGGAVDFSTLEVADIERIYIVRGPLSAIYGGNALAGVINVVTRRAPQDAAVSGEVSVGSEELHRVALRTGATSGSASWDLSVSEADDGEQITGDRFRVQQISAGYSYVNQQGTEVRLTARHSEADRAAFPDDSGGPRLAVLRDLNRRGTSETVVGANVAQAVTSRLDGSASISYFRRNERQQSPGVASGVRDPFGIPANRADTEFERLGATLNGTLSLTEATTLVAGFDLQRESGQVGGTLDFGGFSLPTAFALERTVRSLFVEGAVQTGGGWAFRAGLRADDSDERGPISSPRLSVSYDVIPLHVQVSAAWGKGFKLPSLFALGDPLVGNPQLRAERSTSYEMTVRGLPTARRWQWQLTYFDAKFRNTIDFDPGPPPQLVNRLRTRSSGVEGRAVDLCTAAGNAIPQLERLVRDERHRSVATRSQEPPGMAWWCSAGMATASELERRCHADLRRQHCRFVDPDRRCSRGLVLEARSQCDAHAGAARSAVPRGRQCDERNVRGIHRIRSAWERRADRDAIKSLDRFSAHRLSAEERTP